jgi:hypothetical protein
MDVREHEEYRRWVDGMMQAWWYPELVTSHRSRTDARRPEARRTCVSLLSRIDWLARAAGSAFRLGRGRRVSGQPSASPFRE